MTDKEYEILTRDIYQELVSMQGLTIDVKHNTKIKGKATAHQIDVYWEYEIAGVRHKVAIECKNYNKPVSIGKVRDFYGVLDDIGNINGIMVTKRGYQKGAKKFAEQYGINLKELREPLTIKLQISAIDANVKKYNPIFDDVRIMEKAPASEGETIHLLLQGREDEIWIYDSKDNKVKNFLQLRLEVPHNGKDEKDLTHIFNFKDAYLKVEPMGLIKLREIGFIYDVNIAYEEFTMEGREFGKAILADAFTGHIQVFDKNGKLKP